MYVGTRKRWGLGRLAGADAVRGLGRLRNRKSLGDWSDFATNIIDDAAATAQVALRPPPPIPTYSSIRTADGGLSTQIYGSIPASLAAGSVGATSMANFITPNLLLFGGIGLIAVLFLSRK
jgi:hypothetical protein